MITLKHIADNAGVTVSVVSRALNPRPDKHARVAPETRARIEEAALALGFRRNRGAEFLKRGKSPVLQVFLPVQSNGLIAELMYGMAEAAAQDDFPLGFSFGVNEACFTRFLRQAAHNRNCGVAAYQPGLTANCWESVEPDVIASMKMVTINPNHPVPEGLPSLSMGAREGGNLAARRLLDTGCASLAVVGHSERRTAGFKEEADDASVPICVFGSPADPALESWLRAAPRPVGLFAVTDIVALRLLSVLHRVGIPVPDGARIVGYDDLEFAAHTTPPLTTIREDFREQGREAVRMLVRQIYGEQVESKVILPSLVARESA